MNAQRKIIHIDMDCFYAAIEMRDNPTLQTQPIAVGGQPDKRGVVATCNYIAREFGIHSAMASAYAKRLCPDLIIVKPNFAKYREISHAIRELFHQYTDLVEPLSLDEAYLDVTDCDICQGSATLIAKEIRQKIFQQHQLTASAGVAPNKFLAKVASDWQKPNGQFVVTPKEVDEFVRTLAVKKISGVGKVTAAKMQNMGISTCGDLQRLSLQALQEHFSSFGDKLYHLCRGIDARAVNTQRQRKSLSVERTFDNDLPDVGSCWQQFPALMADFQQRYVRLADKEPIHSIFIKIKFCDFKQTTVEKRALYLGEDLLENLLKTGFARGDKPVRLLGLGVRFRPLESLNNAEQLCFGFYES